MSTYTPDTWRLIKFQSQRGTYYKVFSGWYGGYAGSDEWKLSSAIRQVSRGAEGEVIFTTDSGSEYVCFKNNEKTSIYQLSVFNGWVEKKPTTVEIEFVEDGYHFNLPEETT